MDTRIQIPAKSPTPVGPTLKLGLAVQRKCSLATAVESPMDHDGLFSGADSGLGHNFSRTPVVIQRKCACGSSSGSAKCEDCESKDLLAVQTKALVGPANDPFEHEADAVAERVMRMPAERPDLAESELQIQRACRECDEEMEEDGPIRRRAVGPDGGHIDANGLSRDSLTRGGSPLSSTVRSFFEPRFGRDLSSVRVHTGNESLQLNVALGSYAFTYGNHIWLGRGETLQASSLMAHELAHVVQQTGSRTLEGDEQVSADREGRIRRRITNFWYFEPYDTNGKKTHAKVLPDLQNSNKGLLNEVWSAKSAGGQGEYGKKGRTDLYWPTPKAFVGVYFEDHDKPANLPHPDRLASVPAAPAYEPTSKTLRNLNKAPTKVEIGELKPIGEASRAGVDQIQEYINGQEQVLREVHYGLVDTQTSGTWSAAQNYAKPLTSLIVPEKYTPPNFTGQESQVLVIKSSNLTGVALDRLGVKKVSLGNVRGRLAVKEDSRFHPQGIWNHFWVPDSLPIAALPRDLRRLSDQTRKEIIPSLTRVPVTMQPKLRPNALTSDPAPVVRRRSGAPKGVAIKDPFDYATWQAKVDSVRAEFQVAEKEKGTKESIEQIEGIESAVTELHGVGEGSHLNVPKDAPDLNKLKFWTSSGVKILGRFRQIFGGAFISIARLFLFGREKFRMLIKNDQKDAPNTPGGATGAIVRIIFRVAKYALMTMMPQIVDRLWRSLTDGVKKKLASLIPDSIEEVFEDRKAQLEEATAFLQKLMDFDVLKWLKDLVDPILGLLSKVGEAVSVLKTVKEIISTIKWAIRAINCATALEGNVVGCIGSFVGPIADFLIKKIVENCRVQQTIIPHLLKMDLVTNEAPNWIAGKLIEFARGLLPATWAEMLADPPKGFYYADASDVPCEETKTPIQSAMDELSLLFGDDEAKLFALSELMDAIGGEDLKNVTPEQLLEMGNLVVALGITAEEMQTWARNIAEPPKGIPDSFRQSMGEMFRSMGAGDKAPQAFDVSVETTGEGEGKEGEGSGGGGTETGTGAGGVGTGGGVGDTEGSGVGGTGGETVTGGQTVKSVPSSKVQFQGIPPGTVTDAKVEIVGGAKQSHKKNEPAILILRGVRDSAGIDTVVSEVSATVVDVTKKGKKVISVTYEIQQAVTFDLERVEAARQKGGELTCFRLCLRKGKRRTFTF